MLIQAGFDITFQCPELTPMLLQLNVHPTRDADLLSRDVISSDPQIPMRSYLDHFGNRVTRLVAPPGQITFNKARVAILQSCSLKRRGVSVLAAGSCRAITTIHILSPRRFMMPDRPTPGRKFMRPARVGSPSIPQTAASAASILFPSRSRATYGRRCRSPEASSA